MLVKLQVARTEIAYVCFTAEIHRPSAVVEPTDTDIIKSSVTQLDLVLVAQPLVAVGWLC